MESISSAVAQVRAWGAGCAAAAAHGPDARAVLLGINPIVTLENKLLNMIGNLV
jgi:hypothetical protein